jgi:hypothetical protein
VKIKAKTSISSTSALQVKVSGVGPAPIVPRRRHLHRYRGNVSFFGREVHVGHALFCFYQSAINGCDFGIPIIPCDRGSRGLHPMLDHEDQVATVANNLSSF